MAKNRMSTYVRSSDVIASSDNRTVVNNSKSKSHREALQRLPIHYNATVRTNTTSTLSTQEDFQNAPVRYPQCCPEDLPRALAPCEACDAICSYTTQNIA
jgi:hypothetical protein